jgi:hypothetical protein
MGTYGLDEAAKAIAAAQQQHKAIRAPQIAATGPRD